VAAEPVKGLRLVADAIAMHLRLRVYKYEKSQIDWIVRGGIAAGRNRHELVVVARAFQPDGFEVS
jgi:hypothetical protein